MAMNYPPESRGERCIWYVFYFVVVGSLFDKTNDAAGEGDKASDVQRQIQQELIY